MKKSQFQKIALYIRVSTEEQASNPEGSIKSQEQRLRAHVDLKNMESPFGEITHVLIDRARSGKDTNRPELQRLLRAIVVKEVTLVMLTELSRLSRSIKDFSEMWELMRTHGCEFQSLREQFDTTSAAGEMVIYTIANIAQFERRQTSERISANFLARAQRGLYNGGAVPLGYELDPERKGHLLIRESEAKIIQDVFRTFLEKGTLTETGKALNKKGHEISKKRSAGGGNRARLGYFTPGNICKILTNKTYIGIRTYRIAGEQNTTKAVWEPIVSQEMFDEVKAVLAKNYRRNKRNCHRRYPFLLSGLVSCGICGDRMTGKSAHGNAGKIPYYEHSWAIRKQACLAKKAYECSMFKRVLTKSLESAVWKEIKNLLTNPENSKSLIEEAKKIYREENKSDEQDKLKNRAKELEGQLDALAEHLSQIPKGVSPASIFVQMKRLEEARQLVQDQIGEMERAHQSKTPPLPLERYQEYLSTAKAALDRLGDSFKIDLVRGLVTSIEVFPDTFTIHYKVGGGCSNQPSQKILDFGSNTVDDGGRHRARTYDLRRVKAAL